MPYVLFLIMAISRTLFSTIVLKEQLARQK